MDIAEPKINREEILFLHDPAFNPGHVCLVTGAGTGIGRALAVAAAANGLMTVGLDINDKEGLKTQELARAMGGQMIFIPTDLSQEAEMDKAVAEAAKLGAIRYLANIAGLQHIDTVDNFPMAKYDLMMAVMLRSPFYLSKLCLPLMRKNQDGVGVIGQMCSVHGHIVTRNKPVYNLTKIGRASCRERVS
jgi:3-hydroxybutyrate dehydrogenase